ncbi:DNA polymerase/3'-5' exonuclease PolX [Streptosporangium roseum]|uniref:DNA polymerase beta n=1 Tax=Streptosporangium roseum (strain ATCC 12428 / DSM 43021 / JCM 3005 / KCTC 9067 / NCIMB 10171 / NRRL 2505 / NI 9100) TaxID=479432 RepID=D2AYP2_STRRD|nr:DNA polymerase/3'-5' exonuclease PolX [Streptosporangium roseum]ACZ89025.1 DNA-directed DNA polymerase [Streptosporangium roseum DSM 43021]
MARANDTVAAALEEYAELFAMTGGDAFRVRSYQKAAKAIAGFPEDIAATAVRSVPGVGEAIAKKVEEYLERGSFRQLDDLRGKVPGGVRRLTRIASLGPKKAVFLFQELGIDSPEALAEAIGQGRLKGLKGFGPKTEENLLRGIEQLERTSARVHTGVAMDLAERIIASLSAERIAYAGSLRRMKDTIGDIDILAVGPASLMDDFKSRPYVAEVIASGEKKTSIRTTEGIQVDLRVVPAESWGAAMQYFTGSKEHNVHLREITVKKGWKLSEYGLFDGDRVIAAEREEDIYQALGMPWIPPPLREDGGEITAALRGELPALVTLDDIRGDLHTHTDLTDGIASLEDMVAAARARGHSYYAVTDHAPDLAMQRMTLDKALEQRERLQRLQASHPDMRLLHGTELNIAPDGSVDWPAEVLAGFDVCVASVHSHFTQSREEMTRRFIAACENPHVHIIGHPTTRKIGGRPPVDADWEAVFRAAARTGTAMEIDSFPDRSDLPSDLARLARHHGVKFSIDSDAHAVPHLDNQRFGIGIAQRAWLTADDVINTWPLERLLTFLGR